MHRRTLLQYAGVGALSLGVVSGLSDPALAGEIDTSFEVAGREVGADEDDEDAAVDCGPPTTVYGRIVADESCRTATLDAVEYDDGDLQFRIETVETDDDCTDDCVAIEYAARASGLHERPAGVCVFHDGDRVARVDCSEERDEDEHGEEGRDEDGHDDEKDEGGHDDEHGHDGDDTEDEKPPELDFSGIGEEPPEFNFSGIDEEPPEFNFSGINEEPPKFNFSGIDEEPPEFNFSGIDEEPPDFGDLL